MEQPTIQKKKHVFVWRWLIILVGIATQGIILLLLLVSKKQILMTNATLMPVAGKPAECLVAWIGPFSNVANQDPPSGILMPVSPSTDPYGKSQPCQYDKGGIHIQTVRSKQLIVILISGDSNTVFAIVISNSRSEE